MLALLGGDGERKRFHGRAGSFPSSARVGASESRAAAEDFRYSGEPCLCSPGTLARAGMDGSEQLFKSTEQNVCLGLALNIRNLKYKEQSQR